MALYRCGPEAKKGKRVERLYVFFAPMIVSVACTRTRKKMQLKLMSIARAPIRSATTQHDLHALPNHLAHHIEILILELHG